MTVLAGVFTDDTGVNSGLASALGIPDEWFPILYGLLAGLIILVVFLSVTYYRRREREFMRVQQVLLYSNALPLTQDGRPVAVEFKRRSIAASLDAYLAKKPKYALVEAKLDNAQVAMTPGNWMLIRWGITFGLTLLALIVFRNFLFGLLFGLPVGLLSTRAWLNSKENSRRKKFERELPDFLLLIASALRSGLSFVQAVDSSAADGQGEVSRQMRRALRETQLGIPIEEALMGVSHRMLSEDLKWAVTALRIQREVGGNLSQILETAAMTVKGRAELRREVKTLSAEGRLSGWVLAALPVGLFLYMCVANRKYVSFFWQETTGMIMLGFMAVLFIAGFVWMRKLVQIKV